jgi:hypothetical protein
VTAPVSAQVKVTPPSRHLPQREEFERAHAALVRPTQTRFGLGTEDAWTMSPDEFRRSHHDGPPWDE